jgi:hypothetical protein
MSTLDIITASIFLPGSKEFLGKPNPVLRASSGLSAIEIDATICRSRPNICNQLPRPLPIAQRVNEMPGRRRNELYTQRSPLFIEREPQKRTKPLL